MFERLFQLAAIIDTKGFPKPVPNNNTIHTILAYVFALTATIAVLMIVIGGFRYITAGGDPNSTAQARKTVLYAVIGLLVTMAAYSIVTFVVGNAV